MVLRALLCCLGFIALLLTACSSPAAPPATPEPTVELASEATVALIPRPSAASTTVAPPTETPPSTPTPPPSTPTPSATASATAVPASPTPVCTETRGRIEQGVYSSRLIGDRPYRVYLPPCYEAGRRAYPVLYLLHGWPYDDAHWDELGVVEAADAGIASGRLPPFIVAMPAADNDGTYTQTSGGPGSFEAVLLDDFIPFIESTYRALTAPEQRAIGGISRGGVWSLEIAFRNPEQFGLVGGHSAALEVNRAGPAYDPLHLATDPAIKSLHIYLDVGAGDWAYPKMDALHQVLEAAGVEHTFVVNEGVHADEYWAAHVAEYLDFYTSTWGDD